METLYGVCPHHMCASGQPIMYRIMFVKRLHADVSVVGQVQVARHRDNSQIRSVTNHNQIIPITMITAFHHD